MTAVSVRLTITLRRHGSQDRIVDCALEFQESGQSSSEMDAGDGGAPDPTITHRSVKQDVQGQAGDAAVKPAGTDAIKENDRGVQGALNSGQRNYVGHQHLGDLSARQLNAASQANWTAAQTQVDRANAMVGQLLSGAVKKSSGAA